MGGDKNGGIFLTSKCKILGLECRRKFKLVLAHMMDPSGPFGARTPPKSMCTHEAHPLEKNGAKWPFSWANGDGCAWCPQIMWGAPAPPECVKQGLEPKMTV